MKRRVFATVLITLLFICAAGCIRPIIDSGRTLCITDKDTETILWSASVKDGDQFILEYTHSVHKTLVKDYFRITDDRNIVLTKTAFSTLGAGMPYETEYEFIIEDGFFVIENIDRSVDSIMLRIVPIADHRLVLADQIVSMNDLVSPGTLIAVTIQ